MLLAHELEVVFAPTSIVACGFNNVKVKYQVGRLTLKFSQGSATQISAREFGQLFITMVYVYPAASETRRSTTIVK